MNFSDLLHQDFEALCGRLLVAEGFTLIEREPHARDIGVDFETNDSENNHWVVETKHWSKPRTGTTVLRRASLQLNSVKSLLKADRGLLIVSMILPEKLKAELEYKEAITIWDGYQLQQLLNQHSDIEMDFSRLIDVRHAVSQSQQSNNIDLEPRAASLIARLESHIPGRDHWKEFEDLCVEILNYAFIPDLDAPLLQNRSEDKLDVRDAIYPIRSSEAFWHEIRFSTHSRFVVAEFKNYKESIGQREVESLQQYLYVKAMRTFGLLCSRQQPKDSALAARRRAWVESGKLILLLSDEELSDIIRARSYGENPTTVLDAQLEEFLLRLTP